MFNTKVILLVSCLVAIAAAAFPKTELTGSNKDAAVSLLNTAISKLAASGKVYTILSVGTVTQQTPKSGVYYVYAVTLNNNNVQKSCTISYWSRPSISGGSELSIECPDEYPVLDKQ